MIDKLDWKKMDGLIPVVVQDAMTGQVLMLGYMNQEALNLTVETKRVTFYSRSRKKLWIKGEVSGNFLELVELTSDCDNDTLLAKVIPKGPTCHQGTTSCFNSGQQLKVNPYVGLDFINKLWQIIEDRFENPTDQSYTARLFKEGIDRIAQKLGEEAVEVIIAAKNNSKETFVDECSDLIYHWLVLLKEKQITPYEVLDNLRKRHC